MCFDETDAPTGIEWVPRGVDPAKLAGLNFLQNRVKYHLLKTYGNFSLLAQNLL